MSRTKKKTPDSSPSTRLIERLELVVHHGGSIAEDTTPKGERLILANLRAAAPYAQAIAFSTTALEVGGDVIAKAIGAMNRVDPPGEEDGQEQYYYLLGLLVGLEMAEL